MTVEDDFGDLMPNIVRIWPKSVRDDYGGPGFGPPIDVPGRFTLKQKLVTTIAGQAVLSSSFVTTRPVPQLSVESQVSVDGINRDVVAVEEAYDETSLLYYSRIRFA